LEVIGDGRITAVGRGRGWGAGILTSTGAATIIIGDSARRLRLAGLIGIAVSVFIAPGENIIAGGRSGCGLIGGGARNINSLNTLLSRKLLTRVISWDFSTINAIVGGGAYVFKITTRDITPRTIRKSTKTTASNYRRAVGYIHGSNDEVNNQFVDAAHCYHHISM
jgi:hypothetical protein